MALSKAKLNAVMSWLQKAPTLDNFLEKTQSGEETPFQFNIDYCVGIIDEVFVDCKNLSSNQTDIIDLRAVTNFVCNSFAFDYVTAIIIKCVSGEIGYDTSVTNDVNWFLNSNKILKVSAGGYFVLGDITGKTLTLSEKNIGIVNQLTVDSKYEICILGHKFQPATPTPTPTTAGCYLAINSSGGRLLWSAGSGNRILWTGNCPTSTPSPTPSPTPTPTPT
jgi:hypothetical protein